MTSSSHNRGFTIIETLVAITILMIAIAGPLVIASKGLTTALYSKDQMIASFLAQESMEMIKNLRDNNIARDDDPTQWLNSFPGVGNKCLSPSSTNPAGCDFGFLGTPQYYYFGAIGSPGYQIYSNNTLGGYTHQSSGGTPTIFHRYSNLTQKGASEFQVTTVVNWNEGTIPYQIQLVSQLTDTLR